MQTCRGNISGLSAVGTHIHTYIHTLLLYSLCMGRDSLGGYVKLFISWSVTIRNPLCMGEYFQALLI